MVEGLWSVGSEDCTYLPLVFGPYCSAPTAGMKNNDLYANARLKVN